MFIEKAFVQGS